MRRSIETELQSAETPLSRRTILESMGLLALLPLVSAMSRAQAPGVSTDPAPLPLPLKLKSLINHIGISVKDVTASAAFYSHVVGGANVNGERVKDPKGVLSDRYFITFNPGNVAIGLLGTLGSVGMTTPLIDHFCVTSEPFTDAAWQARLKQEGFRYIASQVFLGFDGIPIQVAGNAGGESLSGGTPAKLPVLYSGDPLLHAHGYDHLTLRVSDVQKAADFFNHMFGLAATRDHDRMWISDGNLRIALRKLAGDEKPGIDSYAIRTARFDPKQVAAGLEKLGAKVDARGGAKGNFRFADPDGLKVELVVA